MFFEIQCAHQMQDGPLHEQCRPQPVADAQGEENIPQGGRHHCPADAQARRDDLGERVAVDDAPIVAGELQIACRDWAIIAEVMVGVVFDDGDVVSAEDVQHAQPAFSSSVETGTQIAP